jgi:sporulation protein YlmC with PRC-barrel domain
MATEKYSKLMKLGDLGETVADPNQDIRGRKVIDKDGLELGKIDSLLIDDTERKIRFLQVETGGFLGIGEKASLIPVDAIAAISDNEVRIDQTGSTVTAAPAYDPDLVDEQKVYENIYNHYGYLPFWGDGYQNPAFPYPHYRVGGRLAEGDEVR